MWSNYHSISIEVRVDGAIEHSFNQVIEGKENVQNCLDAVARAILETDSEWKHKQCPVDVRLRHPWEGTPERFIVAKGRVGTYRKGQEFELNR